MLYLANLVVLAKQRSIREGEKRKADIYMILKWHSPPFRETWIFDEIGSVVLLAVPLSCRACTCCPPTLSFKEFMQFFFFPLLAWVDIWQKLNSNRRLRGVLYSVLLYADLVDENGPTNGRKKCTPKSNSIDNFDRFVNDVTPT